jgi:hypothetical protein
MAFAHEHGLQVKEINGGRDRMAGMVDRVAGGAAHQDAPEIGR